VKNKKTLALLILPASLALASCGTGKDPVSLIKDPSNGTVPSMLLPIASATVSGAFIAASAPYFTLTTSVGAALRAPLAGMIVENASNAVTLRHNAHISVRINGVTSTFRQGEYLNAGDALGTTPSINFTFQVLIDGAAACPYSYLDADGRNAVNLGLNDPCQ
jgi:hypothetical protein